MTKKQYIRPDWKVRIMKDLEQLKDREASIMLLQKSDDPDDKKKVKKTAGHTKRIRAAIGMLTELEQAIIEKTIISQTVGKSAAAFDFAADHHMGERNVYRLREKALYRLAIMLYGEGVESIWKAKKAFDFWGWRVVQ